MRISKPCWTTSVLFLSGVSLEVLVEHLKQRSSRLLRVRLAVSLFWDMVDKSIQVVGPKSLSNTSLAF